MENRTPDVVTYERYLDRLREPLKIGSSTYDGHYWLAILIPVLLLGAVFVVWMYIKDSKSIRWYYALPLGMMRATVYGLLAYMFLLDTVKETRIWFPTTPPLLERRSHLVMLIDVSGSMGSKDDPSTLAVRRTRLQKVIDFLTDEDIKFMHRLAEKNPVHIYRFASTLDRDDPALFTLEKSTDAEGAGKSRVTPFLRKQIKNLQGFEEQVLLAPWTTIDWQNFAAYTDFKPYVLRRLSPEARKAVISDFKLEAGDVAWAEGYLKPNNEAILARIKLPAADVAIYSENLDKVRRQIADPKSVTKGTDLKMRLLDNLSPEGRAEAVADFPFEASNYEWAMNYLNAPSDDIVSRVKLTGDDAARFRSNLEATKKRIDVARTITQGTNVADSVSSALMADKDNMLDGIIVFSDGRSNTGLDARAGVAKDDPKQNPALDNLHRLARKESIPIITVGIGQHRDIKLVRITDLQAPDRTPPDDAFKIIVEVDGENMRGETVPVTLELFPPNSEVPLVMEGQVTFDQSEPPHGQSEWTINPPDILKLLGKEKDKELPEGIWKARAITPKVSEEGKADAKEKLITELTPIIVEKKSVRILLVASTANRDFQFLLTQLIRDKADVSVCLQNEAGQFLDNKSITYLDDKFRHLPRFPDRLKVEDDPAETPETKWLNLARYDVIIAFDPDWTVLTEEQATLLRTWVDLQAGGLLHVAGSINTKKLTFNDDSEVKKRLDPLLEIFPVMLGDNVLSKPRQERNVLRRIEFPGASPEMDFLRLDDDKPEDMLSGWEPFFTGKPSRAEAGTADLKRGFYDYYPIKDVKAGATVVARYLEPQASDNTFDRKDPPYLVTYKYGQGMTAFLGSSEMWRFRQFKDVFFERFWVKMSRFLASGSRKKQNRRGRMLMSREFETGQALRSHIDLLDANLKGLPANSKPKFVLRPIELDYYPDMALTKKDGKDPLSNEQIAKLREDYLKMWTIELNRTKREEKETTKDGNFPVKRALRVVERVVKVGDREDVTLIQVDEDRLKLEEVQKQLRGTAKDFPTGTWRLDAPIPESSEVLSVKFTIRKPLPTELANVKPDMLSLAAISAQVDEVRDRMDSNPKAYQTLSDRAFSDPKLDGKRMAYRFTDTESMNAIPDALPGRVNSIENPLTEPEVHRFKIEPVWFNGPTAPTWMTGWYDRMNGRSEQNHTIALWMLVCIGLLSLEWLSRKMLKLA